jgi:ligand-binding sensor domain-containing protein/signal transduction histidine kinase
VLLLAAAPVDAQPARGIATEFISRVWGTADGLPQNTITSIVQTRDGYLWLGTFGGLVRFDGNAFTVFDPENTPGLASARIVKLLEDRRGVLWIGTEAGLTRYERGRFTTYTTRDGLSHPEITTVFEDSRGRLWVGTGDGWNIFDGRTFSRPAVPDPVRFDNLTMAETPDGAFWFDSMEMLVRVKDGEQPTQFRHAFGDYARAMLVDSKGRLWIGSWELKRWDPAEARIVSVLPLARLGGNSFVHTLVEDGDGEIWAGTGDQGILRLRGGVADAHLTEGVSNQLVRSMLVDRDANVWIGLDVDGMRRLTRRRVIAHERPGAAQQSVAPIVGDGAGGVWVGANCGGVLHFQHGAFQAEPGLRDLQTDCIWTLHRDEDGTLWIGSVGAGVWRFRDGRLTRFTQERDGLANDIVRAIERDRGGALWVGTDAGVSRLQDGRFTNYGPREGLEGRVVCIAQDRAGAMWFGTMSGLYRFENGTFTRYSQAQGLPHEYVRAIHEDADGALWIGTYGGGLTRFRDGRFAPFGVSAGLPDTAVSRIIEDDRGGLWMSGNKGVIRVERSDLNAYAAGTISYVPSRSFGIADGMLTDETNGGFPAGWRTPDGTLWFPTIKGLVEIDPAAAAAKPLPVVVEHVLADGRGALEGTPIGRGSADVELRYTAIDLTAAVKARFRYRLAGYGGGWIEAGNRRTAYYTQVPPGRYTFEVLASNGDGVWSPSPARVTFTVAPWWWQRREVQGAGLALLLAATGAAVWLLSLRRARARVAELEREQALDRERSRIARDLHDDLGSRLTHIAMMADSPAAVASGRIADAARDAARTMDELVWAVNARNDTIDGFAFYLAQFAEEHVVAAGIRCRLLLPPDLPAHPLGADVRRHLYLACKEAVNNAVKHSQASEIRVSLQAEAGRLVVEIADDGRGLPAEVDPTGNGLKNYRERMDAAGGTVQVESDSDRGTSVRFTVSVGT